MTSSNIKIISFSSVIFLINSKNPGLGSIQPTLPITTSIIIQAMFSPSLSINSVNASSSLNGTDNVFLVVSAGIPGLSGKVAAPEPPFTST